jgi:hypothetical protein
MGEAVSGLLRRPGKCAGNSRRIRHIRAELIFRGPQQKCAHNPNEISSLWAELVFRQIPGKLVQRHRHPQRLRRLLLRRALLDPVGRGVFPIPPPPTRLCLTTARALAFRLATGMLPLSYSRVRPEPPATNCAWSFPRLGHGDASSSPRAGRGRSQSDQIAWVTSGERRWVILGERRSQPESELHYRRPRRWKIDGL